MALTGLLTNEDVEIAMQEGHVETDSGQNSPGLILLALFVPWQLLPAKFGACYATKASFSEFCWQIWLKIQTQIGRLHALLCKKYFSDEKK